MIQHIEKKYPVTAINIDGFFVWPILRSHYYMEHGYRGNVVHKSDKIRSFLLIVAGLLRLLTTLRHYKILFSSEEKENREIEGKFINRHFYYLFKFWPKSEMLYLELPTEAPKKRLPSDNPFTVFSSCFYAIGFLLSYLYKFKKIEGIDILNSIAQEMGLKGNGIHRVYLHLALSDVLNFWLGIWRPKVIFISNYYSAFNMALLSAAKRHCIPTIEIQHGVVSTMHPMYALDFKIPNRDHLPDHLFTFDPSLVSELGEKSYIPGSQIHTIGHSFITLASRTPSPAKKSTSQTAILVTLQAPLQSELIEFLKSASKDLPNVTFTLLARSIHNAELIRDLPNNFRLLASGNFYELIKENDIHLTVYSTCALEAPAFGKPNILVNLNQRAKSVFGPQLNESNGTIYINSPSELSKAIEEVKSFKPEILKERSSAWIACDFDRNAKEFVNSRFPGLFNS